MLDAPPRLVALTVPWSARDALAFLDARPAGPRVLVEDPDGTVRAGVGAAATVVSKGPCRLAGVEAHARELFARLDAAGDAPPEVGPRLLGGFAFRAAHVAAPPWEAFPPAWFVLPRLLLTVTAGGAWLTAVVAEGEDPRAALAEAGAPGAPVEAAPVAFPADDAERARWTGAAADTVAAIRRGEAEKVVLAREVRGETAAPAAPTAILRALGGSASRFLVEPEPGSAFVGASPELLAATRGREARTAAVAGSRGRGRSVREEASLAEDLLRDPKERHEHALVVDAIWRGLSGLASEIRIAGHPETRAAGPVQHLVTHVAARLDAPVGVLRVADALHPTPAVCGTPTEAALALISDAEAFDRGWYAGGVGWIGPDGDGTILVALRSALVRGREVRAFAGAGLVAASDPEREWEETELKLATVRAALGAADAPAPGRARTPAEVLGA